MDEKVGLQEIAESLKLDKVHVGRLIKNKEKSLQLTRHYGKRNQLFLSHEDAEKLIASYEARRGPVSPIAVETARFARSGCFYIMQLVPEALPNRVKIGYPDNLEQRLTEHRTAAPTAKLLKAWPCKRSWDYAAMDSITREGCKLVLNEVYEGDTTGFIERAERFFALMPNPDDRVELSEYSSLYMPEEDEGKDTNKL